jgi:ubiquitin-conjugating enzyme E2 variant
LIELRRWNKDTYVPDYLLNKTRYMALPQHKKLPQPQEGTTF